MHSYTPRTLHGAEVSCMINHRSRLEAYWSILLLSHHDPGHSTSLLFWYKELHLTTTRPPGTVGGYLARCPHNKQKHRIPHQRQPSDSLVPRCCLQPPVGPESVHIWPARTLKQGANSGSQTPFPETVTGLWVTCLLFNILATLCLFYQDTMWIYRHGDFRCCESFFEV